jgi:hypothetical protein
MRTRICFGLSALLWAHPVFAESPVGADFLAIPVNARAIALGGSAGAVSTGAEALNSNPAGLALAPSTSLGEVSMSRHQRFLDSNLNQLSLAVPYSNGAIGINVIHLSHGTNEGRNSDRSKAASYSAHDLAVGMGLAHSWNAWQVGAQLRVIQQQLGTARTDGVAADLGVLYATRWSPLNLGLSVRNWGSSLRADQETYQLPLTLTVESGLSFKGVGIVADLRSRPYENDLASSLGFEFLPTRSLSLRAGYLTALTSSGLNARATSFTDGNLDGLTGGLGVELGPLELDSAIQPFGSLGDVHSLTLSSNFGQRAAPATPTTPDFRLDPQRRRNWWD